MQTDKSESEPTAACACLRIAYRPVPERFYVRPTDEVPGGWKDGFREAWTCEACGAEFIRRDPVVRIREQARDAAFAEIRHLLMRIANWSFHCGLREYPSNVLDRAGESILDLWGGRISIDPHDRS